MARQQAPAPGADASRVTVRQFLQIFSAVMLPMFLAAIDQTLLATATPSIAASFGGIRDTTWIMLGYLTAMMVTVPLYGRMGDRYGRRRVLLVALTIFAMGSIACGLSQSMLQLTLARVLQGLGGGGLMVMSQALIGELVPPRERPRFQGYFATNFAVASVSGPLVGGLVVAHADWRWLFFGSLPLTMLALWRVSRMPALTPTQIAPTFVDRAGIVLFAATAILAQMWINFSGHRFAWTSMPSLALGVAAVTVGAILVWHERRRTAPFLPVELLRVPGIAPMAGTVVLSASCLFACIFFLPLYLMLGAGAGVVRSGLLLWPVTLGQVSGSFLTGRIVVRTGRPTVMPPIGLALSAVCLAALGLTDPVTWRVALLGCLCGIGFGTVMPMAQVTIQTLAGREKLGAAAAIVSLSRSFGAVLGTSLFGALVFGLLHGVDLDSALRLANVARADILQAFKIGFLGAASLAACGALVATRLPPLRL
jgi:MFS family permease